VQIFRLDFVDWRLFNAHLRSLRDRHICTVKQIQMKTPKLNNHLHTDIDLHNIQQFSPYITENTSYLSYNTVTYPEFAWLIIMGSGFDDWVYWHFFTITLNYNSSNIELLHDVCLGWISNWFLTNFWLISIHEWTPFYNYHAAEIEVTMSNSSSVLLCCHGNAFVNIRCRGNRC
jgi:hypothetical protein